MKIDNVIISKMHITLLKIFLTTKKIQTILTIYDLNFLFYYINLFYYLKAEIIYFLTKK